MSKKIIFMGSPDFAVPCFRELNESGHEIIACFTREPVAKNRGKKILPTPIEIMAREHNISVYNPKSLRNDEVIDEIKKLAPDFLIVVAYGMILPRQVLEIPKISCLNLHPSKLPRFRGAAPLQRTLIAGDKDTEICIIKMSEELDAGDIYLSEKLEIDEKMNLAELHDKSAEIGAKLMLKTINNFDDLTPTPQATEDIIYAPKISKSEAEIDFNLEGQKIINLIRGLDPFPGAFFYKDDKRIKIYKAEFLSQNHNNKPGTITKDFQIYCQNGLIKPLTLQEAGRKKLEISDFLNGLS